MQVEKAFGYSKLLHNNGNIPHTVENMQRIARENAYQVEALAKSLKGKDIEETCNNIWDFVRENIKYELDSKDDQTELLRTPARTWKDKKGDCDCFTIFIDALLINLNIEHCDRVAGYEREGEYQHIYPVAFDELDNEIIIDCVPEIPRFNYEQDYITKKDYCFNMKTYELGNAQSIQSDLRAFENAFGVKLQIEQQIEPVDFSLALAKASVLKIEETIKSYPNWTTNGDAVQELAYVEALKETFEDIETFVSALKKVSEVSSFSETYNGILNLLQNSITMPEFTTVGEFVSQNALSGSSLGFLKFIAPIADAADTIFGGKKKRLQEEQKIQAEATKQQQIAAEAAIKEKELELQIAQQQGANTANQSRSIANSRGETVDPNAQPKDEKNWFAKNWYWIAGGVAALILIIVLVVYSMKKKKPLNGVRKRRKPSKSKSLNGTGTRKKSRVSKPKPKPRTMSGSSKRTKTRRRKTSMRGYSKRMTKPKKRTAKRK